MARKTKRRAEREADDALRDLLLHYAERLDWKPEEALRFSQAIVSDTREGLIDDIVKALEWAVVQQTRTALIDLMRQSPPGLLEVKWDGKELAARLGENVVVKRVE